MELVRRAFTNNATFDSHTEPHYDVTSGQASFFIIWITCTVVWIVRQLNNNDNHKSEHKLDEEALVGGKHDHIQQNGVHSEKVPSEKTGGTKDGGGKAGAAEGVKTVVKATPPPTTTEEFLRNVAVFGVILMFFYLCDYRKVFPMLERVYDRDEFLFLVFLLFLVGCTLTIRKTSDKILNRDQTEEWKGWMQVMFVWYHVFAAKEWYNWIRVYIAAYVWMTGFGNFSFFWMRNDYSLWRFLKMQFRLNFLVTCLCVVTSNEYMLYYICAMHSYWFISVYVFMAVLKSWNTDPKKMAVKFLAYFIANCLIFEIDVVKYNIFRPLSFILQLTDPRFDSMHEWGFRAGLDHWACFFGMICAYNYPHFEKFLTDLEKSPNQKRAIVIKLCMIATCGFTMVTWYKTVMVKDKFEYNAYHPYTSMIPIVCFIIIRNSFPVLRNYYIHLFAWLGKITLETYLSQLHIYLQSNAKHLIGYIPRYHLLNFALATIIYLPISYELFKITTVFSSYLVPKEIDKVLSNCIAVLVAFMVPYIIVITVTSFL